MGDSYDARRLTRTGCLTSCGVNWYAYAKHERKTKHDMISKSNKHILRKGRDAAAIKGHVKGRRCRVVKIDDDNSVWIDWECGARVRLPEGHVIPWATYIDVVTDEIDLIFQRGKGLTTAEMDFMCNMQRVITTGRMPTENQCYAIHELHSRLAGKGG